MCENWSTLNIDLKKKQPDGLRAFAKKHSRTYTPSKHYQENPKKEDQTIIQKEKRNKKEHLIQENISREKEKDEAWTTVWNVPTPHRTKKKQKKTYIQPTEQKVQNYVAEK